MSKARLVVAAVEIEHRPISEVARDYRVARSWIYVLLARYRAQGQAGLEPRSRRPASNPRQLPATVEERIIKLRKQLGEQGLDAGPHTIAVHLHRQTGNTPALSTIHKILRRRGFITAQPHKRPRSSYIRFQAEQPTTSDPAAATSASRPNNPTNAGKPTSPTGTSPAPIGPPPPARRSRSSTSSTTTPAKP
ncbi:helix-turn-helix domain-containing protein [Mycobacterium simiae]|uniref:helix-turn-helix domain-containing protein n=1 Tax=Mycobacterium simiae TaxID=1784 RepID=UPI0020CB3A7B|nr:helix-turn-helix domain-containing protein [Mycobacterium simiae]